MSMVGLRNPGVFHERQQRVVTKISASEAKPVGFNSSTTYLAMSPQATQVMRLFFPFLVYKIGIVILELV